MQQVDWATDKDLLTSDLKGMQLVTLYLLSTGRNAWHGTWSERYRRDTALFSNFESAKATAEKARNRGTTFEIEQYPGVALFSLYGVICFVEFHSKQPFTSLRIADIGEHLKLGIPLNLAIAPFLKASSEYWETPFPSESSFVNAKSDLAESLEPLPEQTYLKKWGSQAIGSNYYLIWHEKNKPVSTPIMKVLDEFNDQNLEFEIETCEAELGIAREVAIEMRRKQEIAQIKFNEASAYLSSLLAENESTKNTERDK